ncbi:MAG: 4Fe-4S binding protein [Akkermansia sp.]|nr:4Fe-4S binding protein [Akkermansia sp.]
MNNWTTAVFSPTGGTSKIAAAIAGARMGTRIDLCSPVEPQEMPAGAPLLAVVPVYGGRIPAIAAQRLLALQGSGNPAIAVVVYGNRAYEDALLELKNVLTEAGHQVIAAAAFIAEHSIIRSIAADRPHADDLARAVEFGAAVEARLNGELSTVDVPGNAEYRPLPQMPATPLVTDACGGCGMCAHKCPVGAIPLSNPRSTNAAKCILCMRCVAICPRKARILPPPMVEAFTTRLNAVASEPKQPEIYI